MKLFDKHNYINISEYIPAGKEIAWVLISLSFTDTNSLLDR